MPEVGTLRMYALDQNFRGLHRSGSRPVKVLVGRHHQPPASYGGQLLPFRPGHQCGDLARQARTISKPYGISEQLALTSETECGL